MSFRNLDKGELYKYCKDTAQTYSSATVYGKIITFFLIERKRSLKEYEINPSGH